MDGCERLDGARHLTKEWFERANLFHSDELIHLNRSTATNQGKNVHIGP